MFACTQAVYTSRTAGLQYCVQVVPQALFFCQERELTQVPTQQKSSVFIIFQSNEKRESVMNMLHRSGMLGSKHQPSNHICTPGVSLYTAHGWNVQQQHGPLGSWSVKPSAYIHLAAFSWGSKKNGWLSSQMPPPTPAHRPGSEGADGKSLLFLGGKREGIIVGCPGAGQHT